MIDYFIENLTGIKNSQVKNAPKLEEALGRVEIEPEGNFHDGLDDAIYRISNRKIGIESRVSIGKLRNAG